MLAALAAQPAVRTLLIASASGQAGEAVRLGRRVPARGLTVAVDRYCMSACANDVFLPAPNRRVGRGGIVGFHTTPTLVADALAA